MLHGTSEKPARGATMHTSQQSSEVVAATAVADSDAALKLALLAQLAPCLDPQAAEN